MRTLLIGGFLLALAAGGAIFWFSRAPGTLTVASTGGLYGQAQQMAFFNPYTDRSGVQIRKVDVDGGIEEIRRQAAAGKSRWDVADLEFGEAAAACREGLLEPIDGTPLPPGSDGVAAAQDFVPGALGPCWVGTIVYSQIIAFDDGRFIDRPATVADFFDLDRFPGGRGLKDSPKFNLEMALLADGVPAAKVYEVLATPEGVNRAFAKLDTIRPAIVWWQRSSDPADLIAPGPLTMTTALSNRIFDAVMREKRRMSMIWDGQIYGLYAFAVPKGSVNKELALDFIRFATGTRPLAEQAHLLPYGPARRSALSLVRTNTVRGVAMQSYLPTAPQNFARALQFDPDWWAEHEDELVARWTAWRGD